MPLHDNQCVSEQRLGPLKLMQEIDLECLKSEVKCDHWIVGRDFDPFFTCDQDAQLIDVRCGLACKVNPTKGIPTVFETCVYTFDKEGKYNMSFDDIEVCHLDAECQSPYIETNLLHCYTSEQGREHNPWEVVGWSETGQKHNQKAPIEGMKNAHRPLFKRNERKKEGVSMWTYLVMMAMATGICAMAVNCMCRRPSRGYTGMSSI
jgi:hypothetical protein